MQTIPKAISHPEILAALVLIVVAGCSARRPFDVIAHRGASGHAPEHTFAAYDLALQMGADYIEQDLQMTRDGVLVVLHDDTLDRTVRGPAPDCSGAVRDKTWAQLRNCEVTSWWDERDGVEAGAASTDGRGASTDVGGVATSAPGNAPQSAPSATTAVSGSGRERIPTLDEVLRRYGQTARYYIETKQPESAPGMEEELLRLLQAHDLLPASPDDRRVLIQSFSRASLEKIHALGPELPLVQLMGSDEIPQDLDAGLGEISVYAIGIGPSVRGVTEELIAAAHRNDLIVHPYTVDEEAEMRRLVGLGVDGMFTNFPDRLVGILSRSDR